MHRILAPSKKTLGVFPLTKIFATLWNAMSHAEGLAWIFEVTTQKKSFNLSSLHFVMARYVCWHNFLLLIMVWLSCVLCIIVFYLFVCGSIFVSYLYPGRDPASSHQGLPHKPPITGGTTPFHVLCIQLTIRHSVSMGKYTFILTCLYTYSHILFKQDHWMSEQLPCS